MFSRFRKPPAETETAAAIVDTARWVESRMRDGDGFRFAEGCPRTLLATAFGICALEVLGALDGLASERRRALAASLMACQDPETGLFRDPLHGDEVVCRLAKFTPLYIEWQESYFALHALDALGERPAQPLRFVEPFRERSVIDAWLRTLRFDDFWFASNFIMFLLFFQLQLEGDRSASAHHLLDRLDARQDPETGFWGTQQGASLFNGMAGAFHVYGFYQYLDRPIAHQSAAVRSTLSLQQQSGLFGPPGGGPCEDLDAVDILVKLAPGADSDEGTIRKALERTLEALRACRNADGAYTWSSPQPKVKPRRVVYSGLETLTAQSDAGDLWSTWFRPLAIALCCERLGQPVAWDVRYRRLPLLGWHRPLR